MRRPTLTLMAILGTALIIAVVEYFSRNGRWELVGKETRSSLNIFNEKAYLESSEKYPLSEVICRNVNYFQPSAKICVYKHDKGIAALIAKGKSYEREISIVLQNALAKYNAILLDIGANFGLHTLMAAASGYIVWAVDPVEWNLVKLYKSATLNNITHRIRMIHHAVGNERGKVIMHILGGGNVNTQVIPVEELKKKHGQTEVDDAVLLSDIVEDLIEGAAAQGEESFRRPGLTRQKGPIPIVVKIDIEWYECRAFLGSPQVFTDKRVFIPYIVMEWTFSERFSAEHPACPQPMLLDLIKMLVSNGYQPYDVSKRFPSAPLEKLDPEKGLDMHVGNLLWRHSSAADIST